MSSDADPLRPPTSGSEPSDPDELPFASLGRADDSDDDDESDRPERPARTWWYVAAAAVIVVVGMVIGILVFNSSAPDTARGDATAQDAARDYVSSINAGNLDGAAAIACTAFVDEARSAARSGKDPGIGFTLGPVTADGKTHAIAVVTQHLTLPGSKQTHVTRVSVVRSSGRWLMCGQTP